MYLVMEVDILYPVSLLCEFGSVASNRFTVLCLLSSNLQRSEA